MTFVLVALVCVMRFYVRQDVKLCFEELTNSMNLFYWSMHYRLKALLFTSSIAILRLQDGRKHQATRCSKYSFNDDFREEQSV
ncbi:Protein of unknown function [Gryllus bimaculatus]|nr:Protein of unknown function [Gryllus bimaculatus]